MEVGLPKGGNGSSQILTTHPNMLSDIAAGFNSSSTIGNNQFVVFIRFRNLAVVNSTATIQDINMHFQRKEYIHLGLFSL